MDVEEKKKQQQRKRYDGHMGGDSTCILADRLGGSELGSGLRLGEESVVGWRQRHEREKNRQKGRSFKSKSPRSMAASASAALSS